MKRIAIELVSLGFLRRRRAKARGRAHRRRHVHRPR